MAKKKAAARKRAEKPATTNEILTGLVRTIEDLRRRVEAMESHTRINVSTQE